MSPERDNSTTTRSPPLNILDSTLNDQVCLGRGLFEWNLEYLSQEMYLERPGPNIFDAFRNWTAWVLSNGESYYQEC